MTNPNSSTRNGLNAVVRLPEGHLNMVRTLAFTTEPLADGREITLGQIVRDAVEYYASLRENDPDFVAQGSTNQLQAGGLRTAVQEFMPHLQAEV